MISILLHFFEQNPTVVTNHTLHLEEVHVNKDNSSDKAINSESKVMSNAKKTARATKAATKTSAEIKGKC